MLNHSYVLCRFFGIPFVTGVLDLCVYVYKKVLFRVCIKNINFTGGTENSLPKQSHAVYKHTETGGQTERQ